MESHIRLPGDAGAGVADQALVLQVVEGSQAALAELYDRHAATVFARALRLSGDRVVAEEVVQDTFLALWNRAELFDASLGSLAGWLLTIARNRTVDRARSASRRLRATSFSSVVADDSGDGSELDWIVASAVVLGGASMEAGPELAFEAKESHERVAEAIAKLEGLERKVILLAYRDELSQSEIAARLGWPLGTVKTRTRRALRRLRNVLEDAAEQDRDPSDSGAGQTLEAACSC